MTRLDRRAFLVAALSGAAGCAGRSGRPTRTPTASPPAPERFDGPLAVAHDHRAAGRRRGRPFGPPLDRWTVGGARVTDGSRRAGDSRSVRLVVPDGGGGLSRSFPDGVDLSDRTLSVAVRPDPDARPSGVYCQLFAPDADNRVDLWQGVFHEGWTRLDFAPREAVGDPDLTDVRRVGLRVWAGAERQALALAALRAAPKPDRGAVMFTFDDGTASQFDPAATVLRDHGLPGVIAPIPGTVGDDGRATLDQLHRLHDEGWAVANHPQEPEPLPAYSAERQRTAMRETKRWLLDNGFERGVETVVWPYGGADAATLSVGRRLYRLGLSGGGAAGLPPTDPLTVARVDGTDVARTRRLLDLAATHRALVVVMYHPVGTGASNAVSEAGLRETVAHAAASDLRPVTPAALTPR